LGEGPEAGDGDDDCAGYVSVMSTKSSFTERNEEKGGAYIAPVLNIATSISFFRMLRFNFSSSGMGMMTM